MLMKRFLQLAVALCITVCAHAQFSGTGSGTSSDPYLIFNPIQLDQVRNFLGKTGVYFKMMADIDLTQFIQENYPTQGWLPIGNSSSAFKGEFDGNGKKITNMTINRPSSDNLGLFGYTIAATIKNVEIQGEIIGNNYIGGVVGFVLNSPYNGFYVKTTISEVKTDVTIKGVSYIGGIVGYVCDSYTSSGYSYTSISNVEANVDINGTDYLGGVVGYIYNLASNSSYDSNCFIYKSIVNCNIKGNNSVGGIVGYENEYKYSFSSFYENYVSGFIQANNNIGGILGVGGGSNDSFRSKIYDNYFVGSLIGNQRVGGICGNCSYTSTYRNYTNASISGSSDVGGIIGYVGGEYSLTSNVAINETISGKSNVGRIYGGKTSSYTPASTIGTANANKALTTTKLIVNDIQQTVDDTEQHGQSVGKTMLQYKATYQGVGWDFSSTWNMQETETYPYLAFQSAPPVIDATTALSGSKQLKGQGAAGAKIYVKIGDKSYSTTCLENNTWSIDVEQLVAGSEISAYAVAPSKKRSYITRLNVSYAGAGTEADPYRIYTKEELANMNAKGHYILMNDIDLSSVSNWTPIAENSTISGSFNGQNYTISGLTVNSTNSYAGLFAACTDMTIKNLNLAVKKISGSGAVGSLVAKSTNSQFENCHVTITSSLKGVNEVGGLIGLAQEATTITNCSVTGPVQGGSSVGGVVGSLKGKISKSTYNGTITSTTSSAKLGGIVGVNAASVSECKSSGKVACTASGSIVGGLIGENGKYSIENCYSTMTVTANKYAGGLVGYNYGKITNCYASGNLTSTTNAGGVVGSNDGTSAVVAYCCAMNNELKVMSSTGIAIRVIGGLKNSAPLPENNYALKTMAVSVNGVAQTIYDDNINGVAYSASELKEEMFYLLIGWDMVDVWGINEGKSYPYLQIFPSTTKYTDVTVAACDSYTWNSKTYTQSGEYTYTTTAANGCDSIVTLHLTINKSELEEYTAVACDEYVWNGVTYTESGDYTYNTTTAAGCERIEILYLTINKSEREEYTVVACDEYVWNGVTYTESGDYTYNTTTAAGCERIEVLHLTINKSEREEYTEVACDSYEWHGVTYTESGDYTYNTTTAAGCERIEVLHLTINKSEREEYTAIACDEYVWNGVTYTESGDYTYNTTTAAGCERVEVLHLTINKSEHEEYTAVACDEYVWNGMTYTESGEYIYTTTAVNGCDRIEILHLTILPAATTEYEELALCPSELPYDWYGQSLTEAGTYTATEQYAAGCDSAVHELTLRVYIQTLPELVTLPMVREGEAIDVSIPTAEIQAHIAAETWYAPNAIVEWYIQNLVGWSVLSADPVKSGTPQVVLKYVVTTDCASIESEEITISVETTAVDNIQTHQSDTYKILRDDKLWIIRNGKIYSAQGHLILSR